PLDRQPAQPGEAARLRLHRLRPCGGALPDPTSWPGGRVLGSGGSKHRPSTRERSVAAAQDGGEYRTEHDSMGEVRVPAWAKWRAQTQRAVENFPISGTPIERELIAA